MLHVDYLSVNRSGAKDKTKCMCMCMLVYVRVQTHYICIYIIFIFYIHQLLQKCELKQHEIPDFVFFSNELAKMKMKIMHDIFEIRVCALFLWNLILFWKIFVVALQNYGSHFGLSHAYEKCIISFIKRQRELGIWIPI